MKVSRGRSRTILWFALSLICAACMSFYVTNIWSRGQYLGFSDLSAPWWGSHELFLHHRDPYSVAVAHEIQTVIYGAPAISSQAGDPSDIAGGFAYPLYTAFFLGPTVYMPFHVVKLLVICLSGAVTVFSLFIWLRLLRFRRTFIESLTLTVFLCGCFPIMQGIQLQNLSLIAAGLLTVSVFLVVQGHLNLGGILLAASTFKPQFTVVLILWMALWVISDWRRRQNFAWSFIVSMICLVGAAEWLMPGWVGEFVRVVGAYRHYTFGKSLLDIWFTNRWSPVAATAVLVGVLALWWRYRTDPLASPANLVGLSLFLATTLVVIPTLSPHAQILLLPGILCLLRYPHPQRAAQPYMRLALLGVWFLLVWPWVSAAGLTIAASIWRLTSVSRLWELPLYSSPILPFAVAVALAFLIRNQNWEIDSRLDSSSR